MDSAVRRSAVLLDLDGTLTDPFVGITASIAYALEKLGRSAPPAEGLTWCIGPPIRDSFVILLGTDDAAMVDEGVRLYRERYAVTGKFENRLIKGIPEALAELSAAGHFLSLATSKLSSYAGDIVHHFGLSEYLDAIHGSEPDGTNADKADLVRHILATEGIEPSRAVMVGDRSHDMVGASANGVAGIGVLWGYGSRAELEEAGAERIAEKPGNLPGVLGAMVANG